MQEKIYNYIKMSHHYHKLDETVIHHILVHLNEIYSKFYIYNSDFIFCDYCKKFSIWIDKKMVYPQISLAPLPAEDMPDSVKNLYNEARAICNQSPRGACSLLRLAIQILIKEIGENEKNLNKAIGNLVTKGLPKKIQKAFDTVRIIGNNAVHPGTIDLKDNLKIVHRLFKLVNLFVKK